MTPPGRALDMAVATALGYTMYHYDKDVAENCYWMLMASTFEPAALGWHDGERRTEEEAWMDCPHFSTDVAAAWQVVGHMRDLWTAATAGVDGLDNSFVRPFDDTVFFEMLHRHADRRWPWAMLYLTPDAICNAALAALGMQVDEVTS